MRAPSESTEVKLDASETGQQPPPPKPGEKPGGKKKDADSGSDEAAAEMLRKLRRFR